MDDYERYAELLLQKEEAVRDADEAAKAYLREFGKTIEDTFSVNIEAIRYKKLITLYQKEINHGRLPDREAIQKKAESELKPYYARLKAQKEEIENAHRVRDVDSFDFEQTKRIYRRLMKLLHPDMSPLIGEYPDLNQLFSEIQLAYKCVDFARLTELEVMVNLKLKELGIETVSMLIPDLDAKISETEAEITYIITNVPYSYRDLLTDSAWLLDHSGKLEDELNEAIRYRDELKAHFEELTEGC